MENLIDFDNVSRFYSGKQALVNVSCSIQKNEIVYLTGPSGAGKSTFLKLIALQEQPCEGIISLNGYDIAGLSQSGRHAYRQKIGFIHQSPRFVRDFTIAENVTLPLRLRGLTYSQAERRVRASLYKVGLLSRANSFFDQLSGGEKQRAEIARAIVHKPILLLADEPTGNLDYHFSQDIMRIFYDFNQLGTTIVISTHDRQVLSRTQKRIFGIESGKLTQLSASDFQEESETSFES